MRQQYGSRLGADASDAGDVVHRVPGQRQIVRDLVRMHAVARLHAIGAPALAFGVVILLIAGVQELGKILVGGHDHAVEPRAAKAMRGAADQVVGLEIRMRQGCQAQAVAERLAPQELAFEFGWGGVAIGLVGGIQRVAEAGVQCLVERHRHMLRAFTLQQIQQEAGEAVKGVGGPAVGVVELVRHRMPSAEHVQRGVDEVQPWGSHAALWGIRTSPEKRRPRPGMDRGLGRPPG